MKTFITSEIYLIVRMNSHHECEGAGAKNRTIAGGGVPSTATRGGGWMASSDT